MFLRRFACRMFMLGILLMPLALNIQDACAARKLVGVIYTADLPRYRDAHRSFVRTLAQKGYENANLEIVEQFPNADPISWANAIRKFMGLNADLIITYGAPAALAAFKEGVTIPLVFADVYGPVEIGIVTNMTRPGANLTGISSKVPLVTLLKMIQDILPVRHLGVIYSSREAGSLVQLKELRRLSAQLGISLEEYNAMTPAGFDSGLTALLPKVDGLLVTESTVASRNFERIIRKATDAKIPVLTMIPDSGNHGALISLEVNAAEQGQIAAEQAARILGGGKADSVSIATPRKVELYVNLKSARSLDLQVPFSVLSNATKIIK